MRIINSKSNLKARVRAKLLSFIFTTKEHIDPKEALEHLQLKKTKGSAHLDLGSGPSPRNIFNAQTCYGVDIRHDPSNPLVRKCDLNHESLPFANAELDSISAFDFLEHINRTHMENGQTAFPFIKLMNEVYRTLKPGGVFFNLTPCFPFSTAFQDPTHVNVMTEDTMELYFAERAWAKIYGFQGAFELVADGWHGTHFWTILKKPFLHLEGHSELSALK